jgi:hypothetical protein
MQQPAGLGYPFGDLDPAPIDLVNEHGLHIRRKHWIVSSGQEWINWFWAM